VSGPDETDRGLGSDEVGALTDGVVVVVPAGSPQFGPEAARALLALLIEVSRSRAGRADEGG
jgi:hypothetical protein